MKRQIIKLAVIACMLGSLAACSKEESTEDIAIITERSQQGYVTEAIAAAAQQYAEEKNLIAETHEVAGNTADDYMVAIQEAAKAGASVIVGYGEEFEAPLYTMQKKYRGTKFLIVDGAPRKEAGKKEKIRKNTHALVYNEAQAGFLAGYAAVKDGYRSLGFMGSQKESSVAYYGSGFVQGAEYAAKELGLSAEEVTVRYRYLNTNEISPSVMAAASQWYTEGCQVIFASGGSIATAVIKAAEQADGKVIASDVIQASENGTVLTSAVKNVGDKVTQVLNSVFEKKFEGKVKETLDVTNDGVGLALNQSVFAGFTDEDYKTAVKQIEEEKIVVQEAYVSAVQKSEEGLTHLTLDFQ